MTPAPERTLTPPELLEGSPQSPSKPSSGIAANMCGVSPIRHSISMLEMNEMYDVNNLSSMMLNTSDRSLGEECHGGLLGKKQSSAAAQEEEEDDFLFLDTEDEDDVYNNLDNLVVKAAKSPSADASSSSSCGGMRRVQSMGVMAQSSSKKINPYNILSSMAPDIHTIHEGSDDEGDNDITNKKGKEQMVQVNFGDKEKPPTETNMTRRPSSNSLRHQGGDGLRNSLNSSNHGGNLRHSLNSSTHSGGNFRSLNSSSHSGLDSSHRLDSSHCSTRSQPLKSCMKKSTSSATLKSSTSCVSFGELEIRSYNMTVGNTPTPNGVPLSLDWEYDPEATQRMDVDTYEFNRGERRDKHEMFVPNQYRVYLLMKDAGLSRREIRAAIEDSQRAFKLRQKTVKNLKMQPVEEALEKTKKSFTKIKKRLGGQS